MAHMFSTDANSEGSVLHASTASDAYFTNDIDYSSNASNTLPSTTNQPIVHLDASQIYQFMQPSVVFVVCQ